MAPRRDHKTSAHRLRVAERDQRCLDLRLRGLQYREIARIEGYQSGSGPVLAVERALRRAIQPQADAVRKMEAERLDMLWAHVWARIEAGDPTAVGWALRVMERRARLLGLDAQPAVTQEQVVTLVQMQVVAQPQLLPQPQVEE